MDIEGRWEETRAALIGIAEYAMKCRGLTDIDLRFFNSATILLNIQVCPIYTSQPQIHLEVAILEHLRNRKRIY